MERPELDMTMNKEKEDRHGHREERNESMKSKKNRNITYMRKHTHKRHKKEEFFLPVR